MADKPPSDEFMRELLADTFMTWTCPHCNGRGQVRCYHGDYDTCPTCHGAGNLREAK